MEMEGKTLAALLDNAPSCRIMVIGDIMLDEYLTGTVERISPEAPIPVVNLQCGHERDVRLGGAANVYNNLVSLGTGRVELCGVVGNDADGELLRARMECSGMPSDGLIVDATRPTIVKTRIIAQQQQVIRLDRERRDPVPPECRARVVQHITARLDEVDAVIFSDYEKGLITPQLLDRLLPELQRRGIMVAVDPKFLNFRHFRGVTIVVPNRKEASGYLHRDIVSEQDEQAVGRDMIASLDCYAVLLKLGERGMRLIDRDGGDVRIKTAARQVYDVTGAGDTVISVLTLARAAGASWAQAAVMANLGAGMVINTVGTTAVDAGDLRRELMRNTFPEP